jgi:hypothetical protein
MTAHFHKLLTRRMSGNLNSTKPCAVLACTEIYFSTQGTFYSLHKEPYFGCYFLGACNLGIVRSLSLTHVLWAGVASIVPSHLPVNTEM